MAVTSIRADHWEVASCGSVGGGAAVTAGLWVFQFRNRLLNQRAVVGFGGPGMGYGWRAGGTTEMDFSIDDDNFSPIDTIGEMSLDDLNGASGCINSFDACLGIGFGAMLITACSMRGTLFDAEPLWGPSSGLAMSLNAFSVGVWGVNINAGIKPYLVKREPIGHRYPPWVQMKCRVARQSITVGSGARVSYTYDTPVPMPGESVMTP